MWNRAELKDRAKFILKTNYWKAFLVSIILSIAAGGLNSSFNFDGEDFTNLGSGLSDEGLFWLMSIFIGTFIIIMLVTIAFRFFLGFTLEVGAMKYFIQAAQQNESLNYLGYGFNKQRYFPIIITMFVRGLFNALWYLLLFVPGIIKHYSYSMVPYLLAENPHIGTQRAITLSRNMTRGHKLRMFVLDLSFIGWYLLGFLACCIGVIFVLPYYNATKAELYLFLRYEALRTGMTSETELNLVPNYYNPTM